jgi:D-serine deaminase-like pyridoxal phosphate-dependent protein
LETPHLLIDGAKVARNIEKMAGIARERGVKLRPHVKTHKIPMIARRQLESGAAGITVAKVSEAEVMADGIAYPLVTDSKIRRAIRLSREGVRLVVGVDSLEGGRRLSRVAALEDHELEVRLEVDTGLRRTGVRFDRAVELAAEITELENLRLSGLYTFRGAVLESGIPTLELKQAGLEEGKLMASLADRMRDSGIEVEDVSVGSTPTAGYAGEVEGVTEIRPGAVERIEVSARGKLE